MSSKVKTKQKVETQQDKKTTISRKKTSIFGLVGIAFLGIFNLGSMVTNYSAIGLASIPSYIFAVTTFLLPFALILAEFASLRKAQGKESGLNSWLSIATTKKITFWTSFLFWFANLTYFMGAVPSRVVFMSFAFTGKNIIQGPDMVGWFHYAMPFFAIALFEIATYISTKGTAFLGNLAKVGAALLLSLIVIFTISSFAALGQGYVAPPTGGEESHIPFEGANFMPAFNFHFFSVFIWILMASDGAQSLGVYVNDTKGGQKGFIKGLLIAVVTIGVIYSFGSLLVEIFPPAKGAYASALFQTMSKVFGFLGMGERGAFFLMGWIMLIATFAGLLMWTSAPVKVFFSEAPEGFFPKKVTRQNKHGVPELGALIQFMVVIPFFLIPLIGSSGLDDFTEIVKKMGGSLGMIPPLFIFGGYIFMRTRKDYEDRTFKMGSRTLGIAIGSILFAMFTMIFFISLFDTFGAQNEDGSFNGKNIGLAFAINFGAIFVFFGPFWLFYERHEFKENMILHGEKKGLTKKQILNHYALLNQVKSLFNKEARKNYLEEKNNIENKLNIKEMKQLVKNDKLKQKELDINLTKEAQKNMFLKRIWKKK